MTGQKEIKCVIWDLDNTIWEGVILEDTDVKLKKGIRDIIIALDSRGILHSIASKNNQEDAMQKLREFGLEEYFLYPEINWNAKSSSILNIQKNLNIGFDTLLFIDDQPFERDEVSFVHEQVTCFDALDYETLLAYPRCNPIFITEDSRRRRQMYLEDMLRKKEEEAFQGPAEGFLKSLEMDFTISRAKEDDLKRATELTERTHQLNSTGITFGYEELNAIRTSPNYRLYISELTDKYGSYGKIGLAVVEIKEDHWYLRLLLMSCRVISRGVGTVQLYHIMNEAKSAGKSLRADFKRTDRNRMMYVTYKFANFKELLKDDDGLILLENDLSIVPEYPPYLKLNLESESILI